MKPFDLEAAKRGEPIVTRLGRKAKFIAHVPELSSSCSVIALVEGDKECTVYSEQGVFRNSSSFGDLCMESPPMWSINGYEYPEPVRKPLEIGQEYWVADHTKQYMVSECLIWGGRKHDMFWLYRGLIHLTKEAAEAHHGQLSWLVVAWYERIRGCEVPCLLIRYSTIAGELD